MNPNLESLDKLKLSIWLNEVRHTYGLYVDIISFDELTKKL